MPLTERLFLYALRREGLFRQAVPEVNRFRLLLLSRPARRKTPSTTRRAPQTVPDRSCASHHSAAAHFLPECHTAPSACAPVPVHGAQCPAETPAARPAPGCTAPRRCCFHCGSMDDNKPHACRSAMRFPVPASAAVFGLPKRCNALRCLPPAVRSQHRELQYTGSARGLAPSANAFFRLLSACSASHHIPFLHKLQKKARRLIQFGQSVLCLCNKLCYNVK